MAYDRRDGISYVDDIPLKIGSAFLPPNRVVLPTVLTSSEELFSKFEYDFSLEKKVLEDIKRKEQESLERTQNSGGASSQPGIPLLPSTKPAVQNILPLQSEILLPKPQKVLEDKVLNKGSPNNAKINISDFENGTSSPFDYMELQTINDLEELSNVFQGLNNKYCSDNNVCSKDSYSDPSVINNNNVVSNFSKSSSFPLPTSESMFDSVAPNNDSQDTVSSTSLKFPTINSNEPITTPPKVEDINYSITEGSLSKTFVSHALPEVPFLPSATAKTGAFENGHPVLPSSVKSSLRGTKSYSDLPNLSEVSIKVSMPQGRPDTPPSTFLTEDVAISSSPVRNRTVSDGDANCDKPATVTSLPDPYYELSEDSRQFVDAVTDMGFPRAQVSRTVKHLGTDEKAVVEHLCQIQILEESGYDCLEAEAALHLHDYNQDQAKQFLDLINKFQDLGFEKNAVKKALIQNKNDWGKTIDTLLS